MLAGPFISAIKRPIHLDKGAHTLMSTGGDSRAKGADWLLAAAVLSGITTGWMLAAKRVAARLD